jgi:hypothetical protein
MKRSIPICALAYCLLFAAPLAHSQLQEPTPPVNLIIDSGMAIDVDDVGAHAVLWAMADRGEVNVLALICSSANDYSCPTMRVVANYYNHPGVPIGAHMGTTPNTGGSNTSAYTQQITKQFGTAGDIRSNYPDAVTVYRQALAGAADNSVYILANGYYQPLQGLLQSQPDAISPLTGIQLVTKKVRRLVSNGGWFPSGSEGNFMNDTDAANFVFVNWPGEIVSVGVNATINVLTGTSTSADPTQDPVAAAYKLYSTSQGISPQSVHAFGQISLLYAVRGGIGTNFSIGGFNGQTTIDATTDQFRGENFWSSTPQVGQSWLNLAITNAQMTAIINPLLQSSTTMPILRSISPTSVTAGSSTQTVTLTGSNFFSDSQVNVNGAARTTTFISATQVSVQLNASDMAQAGQEALNVVNSEGLGWTSNTVNLTISPSTPVAPTLTAISPASATAGSGAVTLAATGTNFTSASAVQLNGMNLNTTFGSSTQLTAVIPASSLATAGSLSISVFTAGGGTSASLPFTVNNPAPSLASLSPSSATAGSGDFTLTVSGSNFVNGSVVQVGGSSRNTAFVSSTQLTATIPAADVASAGTISITVVNSAPGGGTSAAQSLAVNNPVPSLSSISPANVSPGSGGFTLTVTGSNYVNGSVVQVNGSSRSTTFVSGTQLTAAILAGDVASAGTLSVTVVNSAPGGGTSAALSLAVSNPIPSLSSISPSSINAGSAGFTLTLNGGSFVPNSVVQVNGSSRSTTFVSGTQLTAVIPAGDVASAGTLSITVVNSAPGGGISAALSLAVNNPIPSLSSISPASVSAGSAGFTLTLTGSNFIPGSVVQVNGATRTTTFVSGTGLTAQIPASDVATGANLSITIFNPSPGGGTSAAQTLAVLNPVPSISSISPSTALALGSSFTLTVNGSGFVHGSVVQVNGSPRPTTFMSPTQLTAQISNNDILSVGQRTITVFNAAPGGGTSNSATLTVIGLLGQLTAPNIQPLPTTVDVKPEPFYAVA